MSKRMTPERWRQVSAVFHAALARDSSTRASYLDHACAGDCLLREEVDAMLAVHVEGAPLPEISVDVSLTRRPRLASGAMIGPYRVTELIGAGGMGEVYRARDTKLGRDVAIKVLPASFAADPERLRRFEREARMLAALNHPHVGAIYGIEDFDGVRVLILELVEGPTLADRLVAGPTPVKETLTIARQIVEALEAAHEKGIIHRDLKPANIKVAPDCHVKVLDFGLAKAFAGDDSGPDFSQLPTVTATEIRPGAILGTPAYVSPEQARGHALDKRTDIWAFGCVLYEMLTGRRAFAGKDVFATLAAVSSGEPDWSVLPADTPVAVRRLLRRCLQKDARERLHDISDARIEMQDAQAEVSEGTTISAPVVTRRRERLAWAVAAVASVIAVAVASVAYVRRAPAEMTSVRFTIGAPERGLFGPGPNFLTVSPDGSRLAFIATDSSGKSQLWIRALDSLTAEPLAGTDGAAQPFWSPDSRFLAFHADGSLKKIAVSGGPAQTLTAGLSGISGGTWNHDGVVLFSTGAFPKITIQRVSAAGGAPTPVTTLDTARQEVGHVFPHFLPDGKHFLFLAGSPLKPDISGIYVGSLDSTEGTLLFNAASNVVYSPPGYLLYHRERALMAQPFDAERLQLTGEPVPIAGGVQLSLGAAAFAVSENGVLAYRGENETSPRTMAWINRTGTEQPVAAPPRAYAHPRLSPDGRRVAVEIGPQIWLHDLTRDTLTRFTFDGTENQSPEWTADGKRIVFTSNNVVPPNLFWQLADGSGGLERLTAASEQFHISTSLSADGQLVAFQLNRADMWVLRLSDRKAQPFLETPFNEGAGRFSPDGRWLAYVSDESGRPEIYVQPYPGPGGKWQVSREGGTEPAWNRNGHELFYRSGNKMMAVETTTQPSFSAGQPHVLFEREFLATSYPQVATDYDVSPDGQRFLIMKQAEQGPAQITVIHNWLEELKRRVPAN